MKRLLLTAAAAAIALCGSAALAGETFTATATAKNKGETKSVNVTISIDRFSTQAEKDAARVAFDSAGTTGLAAQLNTMPNVGTLKFEDGRMFDLKLANDLEVVGGRFLTVMTGKPIVFIGGDEKGAKPKDGYDVAVIDLELRSTGKSEGTAAPAAKIKIGAKGGFQVADYGDKTIWLKDIATVK